MAESKKPAARLQLARKRVFVKSPVPSCLEQAAEDRTPGSVREEGGKLTVLPRWLRELGFDYVEEQTIPAANV
jgi:hypothetical protein